jgi:hypothetical protein
VGFVHRTAGMVVKAVGLGMKKKGKAVMRDFVKKSLLMLLLGMYNE